ncbi:unnamed protein product [Durusdinium trenchii]|uniref:DNA-directed DNA polymerase family A palm domain-containing protein n=1 Tax=Durusdinium trenchii TaxID=1381693 RepID=A0ABP0KVD6_9DINO
MVEKAAEAMQVHRQMASVKNVLTAFAEPMQEHASTQGRLHPSWSYGTSTGRLSCSNPNLQALPSPEKDSYKVRSALKAADGHTFILADYSQLELRILAPDAQSFAWIAAAMEGETSSSSSSGGRFVAKVNKGLLQDDETPGGSGEPQSRLSVESSNSASASGAVASGATEEGAPRGAANSGSRTAAFPGETDQRHEDGTCQPCIFAPLSRGCVRGSRCQYCHQSHGERAVTRGLRKHTRDRIKRRVEALLQPPVDQEEVQDSLQIEAAKHAWARRHVLTLLHQLDQPVLAASAAAQTGLTPTADGAAGAPRPREPAAFW